MAITSVSIKLGDSTYPLSLVNGVWTAQVPADGVQPGTVYMELTAVNSAGYSTREYKLVEILPEQTPPVVDITSPIPDSWNSSLRQPILFTATDNSGGSGVDISATEITIDGAPSPLDGLSYEAIDNGYSCTYTPLTDLSEGAHTATVTVVDYAENRSDTASITFKIDAKSPDLAIINPPDGYFTNQTTVEVTGTAVDLGAGLNNVTVNGEEVTVSETGEFSKTVDISEGQNIINVVATDLLGKSAEITRTVVKDTTPPNILRIEIAPDMDGTPFWAGFTLTVTLADPGQYAAKEMVTCICNGEVVEFAEVSPNVWEGVANRVDGYTVEITATDAAGNISKKSVYFDNGFGLKWDWTSDDYFNFWDANRVEFVTNYLRKWLESRGYYAGSLPTKFDWTDVGIPNREKMDGMRKNVEDLKFVNLKDWREIVYLNVFTADQLNAIEWDLRLVDLWNWLAEKTLVPYSDTIYSGMWP